MIEMICTGTGHTGAIHSATTTTTTTRAVYGARKVERCIVREVFQ